MNRYHWLLKAYREDDFCHVGRFKAKLWLSHTGQEASVREFKGENRREPERKVSSFSSKDEQMVFCAESGDETR